VSDKFDHYALLCLCCDRIIPATESVTIAQAIGKQKKYKPHMTAVIGYERVIAPVSEETQ
jgi:hypothetical protein